MTRRAYLPAIEGHLKRLITRGVDVYGSHQSGIWMAVIDTRTGRHPELDHTPRRVYRRIGAPRGSSFYWDQPMIVAAHRLSEVTDKPEYAQAADRYVKEFLARGVDGNGLFLWGNHRYYDAFEDRFVKFSGGYHELRPHAPAWELLWKHDPKKCGRTIRAMAARHVYDARTGGFNRHDNGKREHAFIEAAGVLVESLAWLYGKTRDRTLLDLALKVAQYSYSHRGESTGLLVNNPDAGRWDSRVCTTEVGLWANALLRAADYAREAGFTQMARSAVAAYLKHGYDESAGKYYGQLSIKDGLPVEPDKAGYWPRKYSELWNPDQWPTHDYPMAMAEACITLYQRTDAPAFREGIHRWAEIIRRSPSSERRGAYAGQYGCCILFLARAARLLNQEQLLTQARALADEAVERLVENGWFQGSPGSHLYEAVDGVGHLFLALIELQTGEPARAFGGGF